MRILTKNLIMCQTTLNLIPCCINTQQGSSGTKVPRIDMYRPIILSSKVTSNQIYRSHPLSQRKKATKRGVEVEI